jgi:hypothetical protein
MLTLGTCLPFAFTLTCVYLGGVGRNVQQDALNTPMIELICPLEVIICRM